MKKDEPDDNAPQGTKPPPAVRWVPPEPGTMWAIAAATFDETGNKILAHAVRELGAVDATAAHWAPKDANAFIIPERADVVEWLRGMQADIDYLVQLIETSDNPYDAAIAELPEQYKTNCVECGREFAPQRRTAKYCSAKCSQRAYRARKRTQA